MIKEKKKGEEAGGKRGASRRVLEMEFTSISKITFLRLSSDNRGKPLLTVLCGDRSSRRVSIPDSGGRTRKQRKLVNRSNDVLPTRKLFVTRATVIRRNQR